MALKNGVGSILGGGGAYLRVTTPLTTNGLMPLLKDGVQQTEETLLPFSAKPHLERKNARLIKNGFPNMVAKIEIVSA